MTTQLLYNTYCLLFICINSVLVSRLLLVTSLVLVCLGGTNPSIMTRKATYATAMFLSFDGSTIDIFIVVGRHLCEENGGVKPPE